MVTRTLTPCTRDRYIYAKKNQNIIQECIASKSLVAAWCNKSKMFDKITPGKKTYAEALLSNVKSTNKQFSSQTFGQANCTPKAQFRTVKSKIHSTKIPQKQVTCTPVKNVHKNNVKVTQYSVAGDKTIDQRQQDQLVLSNRFQMLQNLVDRQEQDQQTPHMSPGAVSLPIGIKSVQKNKYCKKASPHVSRTLVDNNEELNRQKCHWYRESPTGRRSERELTRDIYHESPQSLSLLGVYYSVLPAP